MSGVSSEKTAFVIERGRLVLIQYRTLSCPVYQFEVDKGKLTAVKAYLGMLK